MRLRKGKLIITAWEGGKEGRKELEERERGGEREGGAFASVRRLLDSSFRPLGRHRFGGPRRCLDLRFLPPPPPFPSLRTDARTRLRAHTHTEREVCWKGAFCGLVLCQSSIGKFRGAIFSSGF
ncbi:hypothetical protein EUGRSUZ_F01827 [Eucalyptus grandis]|uniref:Uncharacterized protein n=2 Tax=Eucalyptus grandis TaxID=71139 RepID=A0ACC3KG50_EUCGR|nr:hypothetical protein EUGRSUZ_F01827 [Eucalyptus grandis]